MTGKSYSFVFSVAAALNSRFSSTFNAANKAISGLNEKIKENESVLKSVKAAYAAGAINTKSYNNALNEIMGQTKKLVALQEKQIKVQTNLNKARQSYYDYAARADWTLEHTEALRSIAQTGTDFEAAMSKVGAISKATETEMASLSETARRLGRETQFSATQAADAMSYLGMAGWDSQQIIAGMPGLLNLAAAGGTDLAQTADIVSDNLTAFGLSAEQSAHMADVYAAVITSTNTDVAMLGETMKYAAPVAASFGASMEETAALAGLMANAGIKASQAGTALRTGFMRLASPAAAANKMMEELGISLDNIPEGSGKVSAILAELRKKTKDLGDEEALAAMKVIFGQEAATGWLAVLRSGDGVLEGLTESLKNSDATAEKMAERMNDNAAGAMTRFHSAVESLQISLSVGLLPAAANIINVLAGMVSRVTALAEKYPKVTTAVFGVTAALGAAAFVTFKAIAAFNALKIIALTLKSGYIALKAAMIGYNVVTKAAAAFQWALNAAMTANPIGIVITAVAGLIAILVTLYKKFDKVREIVDKTWGALKRAGGAVKDFLVSGADKVANTAAGWQIPAYAKGGVVTHPQVAMVGEDGPEMVVPLADKAQGMARLSQAAHELGVQSVSADKRRGQGQAFSSKTPDILSNAQKITSDLFLFNDRLGRMLIDPMQAAFAKMDAAAAKYLSSAFKDFFVNSADKGGVVAHPQAADKLGVQSVSADRAQGSEPAAKNWETKTLDILLSVQKITSDFFLFNELFSRMFANPMRAAFASVGLASVKHLYGGGLRDKPQNDIIEQKQGAPQAQAPACVDINYAPTINISCGTSDMEDKLSQILRDHADQLAERIKREIGYKPPRTAFS